MFSDKKYAFRGSLKEDTDLNILSFLSDKSLQS